MFVETKETTVREIVHPCLSKWRARIDAAERRGEFNREDEITASDWDMCVCGEASREYLALDTYDNRVPKDERLRELGVDFAGSVINGEHTFTEARTILTAIEARLGEILLNPYV